MEIIPVTHSMLDAYAAYCARNAGFSDEFTEAFFRDQTCTPSVGVHWGADQLVLQDVPRTFFSTDASDPHNYWLMELPSLPPRRIDASKVTGVYIGSSKNLSDLVRTHR